MENKTGKINSVLQILIGFLGARYCVKLEAEMADLGPANGPLLYLSLVDYCRFLQVFFLFE